MTRPDASAPDDLSAPPGSDAAPALRGIGDTLKAYEQAGEHVLRPGQPVVVRLDGNSFSALTDRHFTKPFDARFTRAMNAAVRGVADYAVTTLVAYTQSDEITLLLREAGEPFLGNRTQKLASLLAAHTTLAFTRGLRAEGLDLDAVFDARAFTVPPELVPAVFAWRQADGFRNCISTAAWHRLRQTLGAAQAKRLLHGAGLGTQLRLLAEHMGETAQHLSPRLRQGAVLRRVSRTVPIEQAVPAERLDPLVRLGHVVPGTTVTRRTWELDEAPPRFDLDPGYLAAAIAAGYPEHEAVRPGPTTTAPQGRTYGRPTGR